MLEICVVCLLDTMVCFFFFFGINAKYSLPVATSTQWLNLPASQLAVSSTVSFHSSVAFPSRALWLIHICFDCGNMLKHVM